MATRLYVTNYVLNDYYTQTPTVRGAWDATGSLGGTIRSMHPTKHFMHTVAGSYSQGTRSAAETSATNNWDVRLVTLMTPPLASDTSFTASNTVQWVMGVTESSTDANLYYHVHIYVIKPDGTVRGTLLTDSIGSTEWVQATYTGSGEGAKTLSAVSALKGDRIVAEVGYRAVNTSATSYTGYITLGAESETNDLTQGSTDTTNRCGWLEFSNNITFVTDYYWVGGSGSWNDTAHWSDTSGGTGGIGRPNFAGSNIIFDANSFSTNGSRVDLWDVLGNGYTEFGNLDATAVTKTVTFAAGDFVSMYAYGTSLKLNDYITIVDDGGQVELYTDNAHYTKSTNTSMAIGLGNNTHAIIDWYAGQNNSSVATYTVNFTSPVKTYGIFYWYTFDLPLVTLNTNNHDFQVYYFNENADAGTLNFGTSTMTAMMVETYDGATYNVGNADLVLSYFTGASYGTYSIGYDNENSLLEWNTITVPYNPNFPNYMCYIGGASTLKLTLEEDVIANIYDSVIESQIETLEIGAGVTILVDSNSTINNSNIINYGTISKPNKLMMWEYGTSYYFDGHTSITDPNSVWTNDSNAFNGIHTTDNASSSSSGSSTTNYLQAIGTNITSNSNPVYQIKVQINKATGSNLYYNVYDNNGVVIGSGGLADTSTSVVDTIMNLTSTAWTNAQLREFRIRLWSTDTNALQVHYASITTISPFETAGTNKWYLFSGTDTNIVRNATIRNSVAYAHDWGTENLEGGALPGLLTVSNTGSTSYSIDATAKVRGQYSVKHTATGAGSIYMGKTLIADRTSLYARFKVFVPSSYNVGASGYHTVFQIDNNAGTTAGFLSLENYSGNIRLTLNGDGWGYTDTGVNLTQNAVSTIQIYMNKSATVGRCKIWVNNAVSGSPNYDSGNKNSGVVALRKVYFGKYYSPDANSDLYLDDFAIDASFISSDAPSFYAIDSVNSAYNSGWDFYSGDDKEITKTAQYSIFAADSVQKDVVYSVASTHDISNTAQYYIEKEGSLISIGSTYTVIEPPDPENLGSDRLKRLKIGKQYGPVTSVVLGRIPQNDNIVISSTAPESNYITDINVTSNLFTIVGHAMADGNLVRFESTGTLPEPLLSDTNYYIYTNGSADTFAVTTVYELAIQGRNLIDLTTAGTGTITLSHIQTQEIQINNNQIMDDDRQTLLPELYKDLVGIQWNEVEAETVGLGWHEVGDVIQFTQGDVTVNAFIDDIHITLAGSVKETLKSNIPDVENINYQTAGGVIKTIYNTEIKVDKQENDITSIVSQQDVYANEVRENFSQIYQDLENVAIAIQKSGGGNTINNSVGYAKESATDYSGDSYDNLNSWTYNTNYDTTTHGTVISYSSSASQNAGGVSGQVLEFAGTSIAITQRIEVAADTPLCFGVRVNNAIGTGEATITLSNDEQSWVINDDGNGITINAATAYEWEELKQENFQTSVPWLDVTITCDTITKLQITDLRILYGTSLQGWVQSAREILTANVQFDKDGMRIFDSVHDTETRVTYNEFSTRRKEGGLVLFEADDSGIVTNDLKINGSTSYFTGGDEVIKQITIPESSSMAGIAFIKVQ